MSFSFSPPPPPPSGPAPPPRLCILPSVNQPPVSKREKHLGISDPSVWTCAAKVLLLELCRLSCLVSPEYRSCPPLLLGEAAFSKALMQQLLEDPAMAAKLGPACGFASVLTGNTTSTGNDNSNGEGASDFDEDNDYTSDDIDSIDLDLEFDGLIDKVQILSTSPRLSLCSHSSEPRLPGTGSADGWQGIQRITELQDSSDPSDAEPPPQANRRASITSIASIASVGSIASIASVGSTATAASTRSAMSTGSTAANESSDLSAITLPSQSDDVEDLSTMLTTEKASKAEELVHFSGLEKPQQLGKPDEPRMDELQIPRLPDTEQSELKSEPKSEPPPETQPKLQPELQPEPQRESNSEPLAEPGNRRQSDAAWIQRPHATMWPQRLRTRSSVVSALYCRFRSSAALPAGRKTPLLPLKAAAHQEQTLPPQEEAHEPTRDRLPRRSLIPMTWTARDWEMCASLEEDFCAISTRLRQPSWLPESGVTIDDYVDDEDKGEDNDYDEDDEDADDTFCQDWIDDNESLGDMDTDADANNRDCCNSYGTYSAAPADVQLASAVSLQRAPTRHVVTIRTSSFAHSNATLVTDDVSANVADRPCKETVHEIMAIPASVPTAHEKSLAAKLKRQSSLCFRELMATLTVFIEHPRRPQD